MRRSQYGAGRVYVMTELERCAADLGASGVPEVTDSGLIAWRYCDDRRLDCITYSPVDRTWQGWDGSGRVVWSRSMASVDWQAEHGCTGYDISQVPVTMHPLPYPTESVR